ncbi:MAG: OmpA family protein [Betaproteobacteria bacterium]|nr:OmpA family protein [Betaproteobacteria bacterium]
MHSYAGTAPSAYLVDGHGRIVTDGYGQCWRTGYWTAALGAGACGATPVAAKAPAPVAVKAAKPVSAAPATAPSAKPIAPMAKPLFKRITLQTSALFGFNRSAIRPGARASLNKVVAAMRKYPQIERIRISGYTDRIGSEAYNARLSKARADAVKRYLVRHGVAADRIETRAMGASAPVVSCRGIKGPANHRNKPLVACLRPNRRVVIEIVRQARS